MSTAGFFCRTYHKDADRLRYLLRSYEKFGVGFDGITVACPPESLAAIGPVVDAFSSAVLVECDSTENDFIGQQITKLKASDYCPFDLIFHIDSDCVLTRRCGPEHFISSGKPILYMTPYDYFSSHGLYMPWQEVTSQFCRRKVDWEFMRQFPLVFPRAIYRDLAHWFKGSNGFSIDEIPEKVNGDMFSEFNLLGSFSKYSGREYHHFINTLEQRPSVYVEQFCLYDSRVDRTIGADDIIRLEQILA